MPKCGFNVQNIDCHVENLKESFLHNIFSSLGYSCIVVSYELLAKQKAWKKVVESEQSLSNWCGASG